MEELSHISQEQLFRALVVNDAFSTLPEFLRILGRKNFFKFMEVFGGMTLQIPRASDLKRALRDIVIYERHRHQGVSAAVLAEEYELSPKQIRKIAANVEQSFEFGDQREVIDGITR